MKEYIKPVLMTVVAVLVAFIVYDMFVKKWVGLSFESEANNYDVDPNTGNVIMKAA